MGEASSLQDRKASASASSDGEGSRWEKPKVSGLSCRFCKGPINLDSDFCEACGAPIEDAAPPGMVKPRPKPKPAPAAPPPAPAAESKPELGPQGYSLNNTAAPAAPPPPGSSRQISPDALTLKNIAPLRPPASLGGTGTTGVPPGMTRPSAGPPSPQARPEGEKPAPVITIPLMPVLLAILGLVIFAAILWMIFGRSKTATPEPPPLTPVENSQPPAQGEKTAANHRPVRAERPAENTVQPAAPAVNPHAAELQDLRKKSQQAFFAERYVLPADSSALAYIMKALAIDPNDAYTHSLLENTVGRGKDQVQRALVAKDLATARRVADTMVQMLPDRKDVAALRSQVAAAQIAESSSGKPAASARPAMAVVSYNLYHMHSDRAPADGGPYCQGAMVVKGKTMRFVGKTASDGQTHIYDFNCDTVREIRRNRRVASKQNGFHIRTNSDNFNFAPVDGSPLVVTTLSTTCGE